MLLLAFVSGLRAAPVALDKLERVSLDGQTYVRVRDWAAAVGLSFAWTAPRKSIKLANSKVSLSLSHDSKLVLLNGVSVWLSLPAKVQGERFYVSLMDLKTALAPLVTPVRNRSRVALVAIDPGHGGRDRGFHTGSRYEKTYTLLLAQELKNQLARAGIKSTLVRSTDEYVELSERATRAATRRADLLVSLHYNSAGTGSDAQGVETFVMTPVGARSTNAQGSGGNAGPAPGNLRNDPSLMLAYLVQRSLIRNLAMIDRGVRRARFEVLREAQMPAVLVEGGFMSHSREGQRVYDPVFRRKQAKAIADAIVSYKLMMDP
jgi:N-acetylmuramoyl-L-alanine amidase